MLTFCLTCSMKSAGECPGADHPADCKKQRKNQIRQDLIQEFKECCGVA